MEAEERRVENARPTGSAEASVDPKVISDLNWFRMDISGDFNWDTIFINVFIGVNKNFLKGVKRLLSG